jgi:hypothetical protein
MYSSSSKRLLLIVVFVFLSAIGGAREFRAAADAAIAPLLDRISSGEMKAKTGPP